MKRKRLFKLKKEKIGNYVVIAAVLAMMVQFSVMAVRADYHDAPFTFRFDGGGNWNTTPERMKDDYSSAYMNCTYSLNDGDTYQAFVCGYNTETDEDCVTSEAYYFTGCTVAYMTNWTREWGYDFEYIEATLFNGGTYGESVFKGLWSPDSI